MSPLFFVGVKLILNISLNIGINMYIMAKCSTLLYWNRLTSYVRWFFPSTPLKGATIDQVLDTTGEYSMTNATSAGYYYAVVHSDQYPDPRKCNHEVVAHCREQTLAFIEYIEKSATGQADIENYVSERPDLFACRLLERRAMSTEPKTRSVFDVSYVANCIFGPVSGPFKKWLRQQKGHPLMLDIDPLNTSLCKGERLETLATRVELWGFPDCCFEKICGQNAEFSTRISLSMFLNTDFTDYVHKPLTCETIVIAGETLKPQKENGYTLEN